MTNRMKASLIMRKLQPLTQSGVIEAEDASEAVRAYMNNVDRPLRNLLNDAMETAGDYSSLVKEALNSLTE